MSKKISKSKVIKLLKRYEDLDEDQKLILELKALIHSSKNQAAFLSIFKASELKFSNGQLATSAKVHTINEQLLNHGFIDDWTKNVYKELIYTLSMHALSKNNPRRKQILFAANKMYPVSDISIGYINKYQAYGLLNIAIHTNDSKAFFQFIKDRYSLSETAEFVDNLLYDEIIDLDWLSSRNEILQAIICCCKLSSLRHLKQKAPDHTAIVNYYQNCDFKGIEDSYLLSLFIQYDVSLGNLPAAKQKHSQFSSKKSPAYIAVDAMMSFFVGDFSSSAAMYKKATTEFRKVAGTNRWFFTDIHGFIYTLLLLYKVERTPQVESALRFILTISEESRNSGYLLPFCSILILLDKENTAKQPVPDFSAKFACKLASAISELLNYVVCKGDIKDRSGFIESKLNDCVMEKQFLAAQILEELIQSYDKSHEIKSRVIEINFISLVAIKESWEYYLNDLEQVLLPAHKRSSSTTTDKRLIWLVNPTKKREVVPHRQAMGKVKWGKSRAVSLNKMFSDYKKYDYLTEQDKYIMSSLKYDRSWSSESFYFEKSLALKRLVGHPHIYHSLNEAVKLELVDGNTEIYVEEKGEDYQVSVSHIPNEDNVILEKETANVYKVITFDSNYKNIANIVGNKGLVLPKKAKDRILSLVNHARKDIRVHSNIDDVDIPEVKANSIPVVQMLPVKDSLQVSLWIKPFGNQGVYCKGGHGKQNITTVIKDENNNESRVRTKRNFKLEKKSLSTVISTCTVLPSYEQEDEIYLVDQLDDILETITQLGALQESGEAIIEWPKGETYRIKSKIDSKKVRLNISSEQNWFSYEGEVQISDSQTMLLKDLLDHSKNNNSRFIEMNNGEFLELTSSLKKQLDLLANTSQGNKIHHLNANSLYELSGEAEKTDIDKGWKDYLSRIKKMGTYEPKVPSNLQAELRDYQVEGFRYLSLLSHWGIGGCLADDMGLGKTIQGIALLLEQGSKGAGLIIAPTSLCFNWQSELSRFSPSLKVYSMYEASHKDTVEKLESMDILICSYGMLHTNIELLASRKWQSIILDEAQAIKNPHTKRWKAVMQLQSDIRIALTGTPIENHLGELWSIFNFLNPGMLGSIKEFTTNFSTPIEVNKNKSKLNALKTMVKPYILRRLKSEVLTELPAKTEQTIYIEPTDEELAFYNAIRITAMENLESKETVNKISILAEINKLRLACCDSSLVGTKNIEIANSKIKHFNNILDNILDNGHKVLVFSQYVKFLQKIKSVLDTNNIEYKYIDGSTTQSERKKRVEAFQGGEGSVFLLSLKAGGSGLNLTAADYVIHLDPWWNPAVEDQASDRVHRIGQDRPVTIYRLIMKGMIEEKIIKMHANKRHLSNDLLSGSDMGGKMSEKELMDLITTGYNKEAA